LLQHRFLPGGRINVISADYRENGGSVGPELGGWCIARRNSILPRGHAVRGDVRSDGLGVNLHDPSVRCRMQRRDRLGHYIDDPSRTLRHVLRYEMASHLRSVKIIQQFAISEKDAVFFTKCK